LRFHDIFSLLLRADFRNLEGDEAPLDLTNLLGGKAILIHYPFLKNGVGKIKIYCQIEFCNHIVT